ncbi:MAG: 30S ribosomal protein S8 [Deltaproteobacteria bacterium]|jgi:small subunit ribosomal protein S8|uniref:30S ribosomal protein S8 n=1 Tax=Hydrosulfovibrio ferrireducens TaxID=2934181 RepID=UPI000CC004C0|nr:30S ribosomal protein S8 [Pseudomonadota bacterium]MCG2822750.1 30S ribosomal protein S8 [Desulfobulbaceae bacterium]MDP2002199.1 30S ribosomal protein S8 [Desulfurivibrionaceae bacterium]PKN16437.1 MAG: 30S ribosomal protein S8 [Deltaproteobacteria bacterium HGW-Deltaproteobacteria-3]TDB39357.1 MAG: 30S ribosomal protein S8 [Deltaproteobacteria bacterium]
MSMTDPLADMLTRIRNAGMVKFETVEMPLSKVKTGVAAILKKEGFINDYQVLDTDTQGVLRIEMKYDQNNERIITNLKRVSKPGRRIYVKHDQIPKVMSGLGIAIISTSKGIFTDKEARAMKIGGELLCEVW